MGKSFEYKADNKSFGKFMMSDQVSDMVDKLGEVIAAIASQTAPYDETNQDGSHLRDGYYVESYVAMIKDGPFVNPRAAVRVRNDHRHAAPVEFGTANTPRFSPLRRAALRFGDLREED